MISYFFSHLSLRPGKLAVGDKIISLNGTNVESLTHDELVAMLRTVASPLTIKKQSRTMAASAGSLANSGSQKLNSSFQRKSTRHSATVTVNLIRPELGASFGFGLGTTGELFD